MSEQLIQKLLDIGGCSAETEWARGYDDGVNAAIDVVERYFDQPTLNDNQQVLLKWLKKKCDDCAFIPFSPFPAIRSLYYLGLDLDEIEVRNIIDELNRKQQAQVLRVFSDWVLEQEAE